MERVPIRRRIRHLILRLTMLSMVIIAAAALFLMLRMRNRSEQYILNNLEENIMSSMEEIAYLTEVELSECTTQIVESVNFVEDLYKNRDKYILKTLPRHFHIGDEGYCFNRFFANNAYNYDGVKEEMELLANMESFWVPILRFGNENVTSIYLATESGFFFGIDSKHIVNDFSESHDSYFDYFDREWYKMAKDENKVVFTSMTQDYFDRGLTLTCAAPFYNDEGKFAGVMALDILANNIKDNLIAIDAGEGSYVFAVDKQGNIISSPDLDPMQTDFLNISDDNEISKISEEILSGASGIKAINTSYYVYSPVGIVDWTICVRMPKSLVSDSLKVIDKDIIRMIAIFVIIAIIMFHIDYFASKKFASQVTKPIERLKDDVEIISKGNLDHEVLSEGNDEISDLAVSFNQMTRSLKNYIDDVTNLKVEKERAGVELNIATKIQLSMLPSDFPAFPDDARFDIYATMTPAKEVGGDFYDFFKIDDKHLAVVIADVSGKGIPGALFMAIGKALLRDHTFFQSDLPGVFNSVNNILCESNKENLFITAFEGVIDLETGHMVYVNAGHELPFIYKKDKGWTVHQMKPGFVLGGMEGIKFTTGEIMIEKGDMFYEYTDGVVEATNAGNELYGMDRLKDALDGSTDRTVRELLMNIKDDIDKFVGTAPQFDDITMLAFRYNGI